MWLLEDTEMGDWKQWMSAMLPLLHAVVAEPPSTLKTDVAVPVEVIGIGRTGLAECAFL